MSEDSKSSVNPTRRSILDLSHDEACDFFLKPESYCSLDLPRYIVFEELLQDVHVALVGKRLSGLAENPRDYDQVNYRILHNKDGKYSWRPFELIHPALYISLVHMITEEDQWEAIRKKFSDFSRDDNLYCLSLPVESLSDQSDLAEQISHWWHEIEQRSIELSLDYEYVYQTDITDCYGAIYTHSIPWALHTKRHSQKKENRGDRNLIGNEIDHHIQDMRQGQTNGIPQGSVLMDFIAEMVLGRVDLKLLECLAEEGIDDYQILRYRDDYRIFVNSPQIGEAIVKQLSETTTAQGLKLSASKTISSSDVVRASIKADKLAWMARIQSNTHLQKHLLIIHDHSTAFPNSGSLAIALNDFLRRVTKVSSLSEDPKPLVAIVVDIAYRNPRTYAVCAAILSKLLSYVAEKEERLAIVDRIRRRFSQIPNTGHMEIWLQRITLPLDRSVVFDEAICNLVAGNDTDIWNNDWLSSKQLKKAVNAAKLVDAAAIDDIAPVIDPDEVELFLTRDGGALYR